MPEDAAGGDDSIHSVLSNEPTKELILAQDDPHSS